MDGPLPNFSTFMNFFPDSVSANTTLAYFNGFRLSKADVFSWNPFKKTSVYLVETSAEPGKDINDFWRGKFPKNKHCLFDLGFRAFKMFMYLTEHIQLEPLQKKLLRLQLSQAKI